MTNIAESSSPVKQPTAQPQSQTTKDDRKCANLISSLFQLSDLPEHEQNSAFIKELIRDAVTGRLELRDLVYDLQNLIGYQAQPHLLPFLEKTIPVLRETIKQREFVMNGFNFNRMIGIIPRDQSG